MTTENNKVLSMTLQTLISVYGCPKNMSRLLNYFYFVMFVHCFYSLFFFIVSFVCLSPLFSCVSLSLLATVFLINLSWVQNGSVTGSTPINRPVTQLTQQRVKVLFCQSLW